ncbi:hypothetical protein GCM10009129_00460 [Psychrobacter aestuarii]|uniref:Uncharacterized protein n=2 Tax=Psychrobacter aestuarii TaxID=556327 RepID=A0ABN0VJD9_9GAMM
MIIELKKPICFTDEEFNKIFKNYTLDPRIDIIDNYNQPLDKDKNIGVIALKTAKTKDYRRCIFRLTFNTNTLSSLEKKTIFKRGVDK